MIPRPGNAMSSRCFRYFHPSLLRSKSKSARLEAMALTPGSHQSPSGTLHVAVERALGC